jgi:phosphomannomutase
MGKLFGAYDIRGIYGQDFDDQFACRLGRALAKFISPNEPGRFLVGYDTRRSSPRLADFLTEGLCDSGQLVTVMGVASTPRIAWEGAQDDYDCSIAVTASHLSSAHNGFKISIRGAVSLSAETGLQELEALVEQQLAGCVGGSKQGYSSRKFDAYIDAIRDHLEPHGKIRIAVDGGGSPIGREIEALFDEIELVTIHGIDLEPDGSFLRRSPNPLDEGALDDLSKMVLETKCAFGVAFDGDSDRVVVVDERGVMVEPDLITALLAESILNEKPGSTILYDLRSSRAVAEHIQRLGGTPIKCRVGHSLIKRDMRSEGAVFAGELSAHYYWDDLYCTDNALRVLVELVNILSPSKRTLSQLIAPLQVYFNSGEINFRVEDVEGVMQRLSSRYSGGKQTWVDGLSVEYENWWFNVRASQTEPLLRLCVGSSDPAELELYVTSLTNLIKG